MKINGWDVLKNEAAWLRWKKSNYIYYGGEPEQYPCLVESLIGSDGDSYARFYYRRDLDGMRQAIDRMEETMKKAGMINP